jgi:hypothetical protein
VERKVDVLIHELVNLGKVGIPEEYVSASVPLLEQLCPISHGQREGKRKRGEDEPDEEIRGKP